MLSKVCSLQKNPEEQKKHQKAAEEFLRCPDVIRSIPEGIIDKEGFILEKLHSTSIVLGFPELLERPSFMLKFIRKNPDFGFSECSENLWKNKSFIIEVLDFYLKKDKEVFFKKYKELFYEKLDVELQNDLEIQKLLALGEGF